MTLKRPLATAGAAVLLGLTLTACGGGSPTDASVKEFCDAADASADSAMLEAVKDGDFKKVVDYLKQEAKKIEEVGTPKDMPKEAREGFEIQLEVAKKLTADKMEKALKSATSEDDIFADEVSDAEMKKIKAYEAYEAETCDGGGSVDVPSDLPTELPSGFPTELPSNLPTELPSDLESMMSDLPSNLDEMMSNLPTTPEELESYMSELSQQ